MILWSFEHSQRKAGAVFGRWQTADAGAELVLHAGLMGVPSPRGISLAPFAGIHCSRAVQANGAAL